MLQCIRRLRSDQDGESFQGRTAAVQLSAPLSAAQPAELKRVAAHETTTLAITAHIRWVEVSGNSALQLKANSEQAQKILLRLVRRGCKAQRQCELLTSLCQQHCVPPLLTHGTWVMCTSGTFRDFRLQRPSCRRGDIHFQERSCCIEQCVDQGSIMGSSSGITCAPGALKGLGRQREHVGCRRCRQLHGHAAEVAIVSQHLQHLKSVGDISPDIRSLPAPIRGHPPMKGINAFRRQVYMVST